MSNCFFPTKASLRFQVRLLATMLAYVLFVFATQWAFHHSHPTGLMVYFLAILPAVPLVGSIALVGIYIAEESDEFQRSILIKSMLWSFGVALAIGSFWGCLEDFANAPHRSSFYAYLAFWVVYAISGVIIRLRYR